MNDTLDNSSNLNIKIDNESNLEPDFNTAIRMSLRQYDYRELIGFLTSDKIVERQIAALELNEIKSEEDAFILASNLVGQDGKIREATAFKVNELVKNSTFSDFFIGEKFFSLFLEGIMDINGNVCRQIVGLTDIKAFGEYLSQKLPERINELLIEIDKIDKMSKQYAISKRNFQLYWCLEALYNIIDITDFEKIKEILLITGEFYDYTIREKTARILTKLENPELNGLKKKLKHDDNYYVKRYLN